MGKVKILHINASPEFLANPEKMALVEKMAEIAYGKTRGRREGEHIWTDYDPNHLADKCTVCGILRKNKKKYSHSGLKITGHFAVYLVEGKWVNEKPECKKPLKNV